jgi:DNA excision repair protein ERCC-4
MEQLFFDYLILLVKISLLRSLFFTLLLRRVEYRDKTEGSLSELSTTLHYQYKSCEIIPHVIDSPDDDSILEDVDPHFVVLMDPDATFVRRIELHKASQWCKLLRAYFFIYKDSNEEQVFLSKLRREKEAFEQVIQKTATMVIPLTSPGPPLDPHDRVSETMGYSSGTLEGVPRSARQGNGQLRSLCRSVIVDVREFRSALPSTLHARGLRIHPLTLEVGDYVISPHIVVERKSLPDLVSSLQSGRLYHQSVAMCRSYVNAILLIEFDKPKPLSLFMVVAFLSGTFV